MLWLFYKRNQIKWRTASYAFRGEIVAGDRLVQERKIFCSQVMPLLDADYPTVWMDESSVNGYMQPAKVFSKLGTDMRLPLPSQRHSGLTIFGAVGNCLREPAWQVSLSTNREDFIKFCQRLINCIDGAIRVRPLLILDK